MQKRSIQAWLAVGFLAVFGLAGRSVHAEPVDLLNREARDIYVRFETSPRATPAVLDHMYGDRIPARFEPGPAGQVFVVIEGQYVEKHLFASEDAAGKRFGDFVWIFDSATGDVLDARLEGEIVQSIDWGFGTSATRAHIQVRMSTRESSGFREVQRVFGNHVFRHCDPDNAGWSVCHEVEPVRFDRERGYVNAVGVIDVNTLLGIGATSFSPLGEAIFLESDLPAVNAADALVSATSPSEMGSPIE